MTRKTKANTNGLQPKQTADSALKLNDVDKTIHPEAPVDAPPEVGPFANIVLTGKGRKLSPKTDNDVFFDIALHETDESLYFRLSGNEGGGLHSKEWLPLQSILDLLKECVDKPFKSTLVKPLFSGSSANNAGFLCAALRGIGLLTQSGSSVFLHQLTDNFTERCAELLALQTNTTNK